MALLSLYRVGHVVPTLVHTHAPADLVWARMEEEAPASVTPATSADTAGRPVWAVKPSRLRVVIFTIGPDCHSDVEKVLLRGQKSRRLYSSLLMRLLVRIKRYSLDVRVLLGLGLGLLLVALDELAH